MANFFIRNGELIIDSKITGEYISVGRINGINVEKVLIIPNTKNCIVLLNYLQALELKKSNLLRINEIGSIMWVVGSPIKKYSNRLSRDDIISYTDFFFQGEQLFAYDYSGFLDQINIKTGLIVHSQFVK